MQLIAQLLAIGSLALLVGCAGPFIAPPGVLGTATLTATNVGTASVTALATRRAPLTPSVVALPRPSKTIPSTVAHTLPTAPIAETDTVIATMKASVDTWQNLPLGPPGTVLAAEEDTFVVLESMASLDKVEAFYLSQLAEPKWMLFERLWASETRFGGQAVFLLFWQAEGAVCILATSDPTADVGSRSSVINVSTDCATTRMTAENLRAVPWSVPEETEWQTWDAPTFTMRFPGEWTEDARFYQQPYCQPDSGIRCLVGFVFRGGGVEGYFGMTSRPRPAGKSLEELAIAAWQEGASATPGLALIAAEPIRLDDGTQAVQILSLVQAAGEPGMLLSVDVATEQELYNLTATMAGDRDRLFELNAIVSAMNRSFHVLEK